MTDGVYWTARVTRFGSPSRNGLVWPCRLGPELAEALLKVPVRCCRGSAGFVHPPLAFDRDPVDLTYFVGLVDDSWADTHGVFVTLRLTLDGPAVALRRGMLALQRDGLLARSLGVSIVGRVFSAPRETMGRPVLDVTRVRSMIALDLVSSPAADGSAVLRSTMPTPDLERSLAL